MSSLAAVRSNVSLTESVTDSHLSWQYNHPDRLVGESGLKLKEIVFIDAGVEAPEQLIAGVVAGAEVHLLKGDAIAQITATLRNRSDITNIHIISHGSPGCLYVGDSELNLENLEDYSLQIQSWFQGYSPCQKEKKALILYGCNVATGDAGEEFIRRLYGITDHPILASNQRVGNGELGGNWQLNSYFGEARPLAIAPETQATYPGIFPEITSFTATPNAVEEAAGTSITLTVTTDAPVVGGGSVELGLSFSSTATGSDFAPIGSNLITIEDGSSSGSITLTIQDDESVEGRETAIFTLNNPSLGLTFTEEARETAVTITDDEVPQVNLRISQGTGGETSNPSETIITLTAEATQAVQGDQTLTLSLTGEAEASDFRIETGFPANLVIADGQREGTLSFPIADDTLVEFLETATFTLTRPDATTGVVLGPTVEQTLEIVDNDFPEVSLRLSTTAVTEGGSPATITVTPTVSDPVRGEQTVEVALTGLDNADFTGNIPATITIPDGASGDITGEAFTLTLVDDASIEGTETGLFTLSNPSEQLEIADPATASLTVTDNDFPTVTLSLSPTAGTEADTTEITVTATASQAVEGNQTVQLALSGNAEAGDFIEAIPETLEILDGQTTASFTVTVNDDNGIEGLESATFSLSNPSEGLVLGSSSNITQTVTLTDNDFPTVTLEVTPDTGSEANASQITVTAVASQAVSSTQTVQLDISGVDSADFTTVPPTQLTIPAGQASAEAILTLSNDTLIEGLETATFTLSNPSSGLVLGEANEVTQEVDLIDDDFPIVTLNISSPTATEADTATEITVTAQTSQAVEGDQTIDVSLNGAGVSSDDFSGMIPGFLTIDDGTSEASFTVTVNDDSTIEGTETAQFALSNASSGITLGAGNQIVRSVAIADNDFPEVNLTADVTALSEEEETGETEVTLTVEAEAAVEGNQTVQLTLNTDAENSASVEDFLRTDSSALPPVPTQLTILDGQTIGSVTFRVNDDELIEELETATFEIATPSSGIVLGDTTSAEVQVTDDDDAGLEIVETDNSTQVDESGEGSTDSFVVRLTAQPTEDVVVDITGIDSDAFTLSSEGEPLSNRLTFPGGNPDLSRIITVTGVDNDTIEEEVVSTLTFSINDAESDDSFDNVDAQTVDITTRNDDQAGFEIIESVGSTTVSESGTTDTFEVVLTARPGSTVSLIVTSSATDEVELVSDTNEGVEQITLTFEPEDWNQPQTITVRGVDDQTIDGNQMTDVAIAIDQDNSDDAFDAVESSSLEVTTIDDDEPGITLTPIDGLITTEEGGTATFEVVLNQAPTADVTINFSNGDESEINLPASITFTPDNATEPQTVTITGVDDEVDDGDVTVTIGTSVTSEDENYAALDLAALDIDEISVTNIDDDENAAPLLAEEIEPQAAQVGSLFSLVIPATTFVDEDPGDENLSITLADGELLPDWLSFDPDTQTFTGTPIDGDAGEFEVTLVATDSAGLSAEETFSITVEAQEIPDSETPNSEAPDSETPEPTNPEPTNPESGGSETNGSESADPALPNSEPVSDPNPLSSEEPLLEEPITTFGLSLLQGRSDSVNELIVVTTDDAQGSINGLLPTDPGYQAALLEQATVVFSTLVSDRLPGLEPSRTVNLSSDDFLRFALIEDGSLDSLREGGVGELRLATTANGQEIIEASTLALEGTQLSLQIPGEAGLSDLVLASNTSNEPPLGSSLQGNGAESELFDFRGETGTITATFEVYRDAVFDNLVGFYFVENEQGQVRDSFGNLLNPGDEGYTEAALANRLLDVNLTGQNGSVESFTAEIAMGQLLSTFIIVDGTVEQLLDPASGNDPSIYFTHLGANADSTDHVRLIGDNTFGFEDLVGGGDRDYDDLVISATFTPSPIVG